MAMTVAAAHHVHVQTVLVLCKASDPPSPTPPEQVILLLDTRETVRFCLLLKFQANLSTSSVTVTVNRAAVSV